MDNQQLEAILLQALDLKEVYATGDGTHFQLIVVGELFNGMKRLKREQAVYAPLMEYIADQRVHAVNIRALTPEEWQKERKLMGL